MFRRKSFTVAWSWVWAPFAQSRLVVVSGLKTPWRVLEVGQLIHSNQLVAGAAWQITGLSWQRDTA